MSTTLNLWPHQQSAYCQTAEERRHYGQHGNGFVTQPQRALLRPDNLVTQTRKAGCYH